MVCIGHFQWGHSSTSYASWFLQHNPQEYCSQVKQNYTHHTHIFHRHSHSNLGCNSRFCFIDLYHIDSIPSFIGTKYSYSRAKVHTVLHLNLVNLPKWDPENTQLQDSFLYRHHLASGAWLLGWLTFCGLSYTITHCTALLPNPNQTSLYFSIN